MGFGLPLYVLGNTESKLMSAFEGIIVTPFFYPLYTLLFVFLGLGTQLLNSDHSVTPTIKYCNHGFVLSICVCI